jgi:hypothetical protein
MIYTFIVNKREDCTGKVIQPEHLKICFSDFFAYCILNVIQYEVHRLSVEHKYSEINGDCKLHVLCVQLLVYNRNPDSSLVLTDVNP